MKDPPGIFTILSFTGLTTMAEEVPEFVSGLRRSIDVKSKDVFISTIKFTHRSSYLVPWYISSIVIRTQGTENGNITNWGRAVSRSV